ncbi:response regulator transcription factor [Micromonospora sp. NBC_01796]|uniref:response regulator transcription factor n=1 Tax=Micromonospora sp. NBC_01796 TaxID=2975987 RepID=UPI002DD8C93F|nr:response regulator transcription factor [Micromonospora sp. NBC_01796]WSA85436.1 response regulator transcription factor [Micromonospora sp. NBC_01796]
MRILLVEDDSRVAAAMASALTRRGFDIEQAATAAAALAAAPCDLVLLDLTLPDGDGVEVCRTLRQRSPQIGIIAVTARGEERDRVLGLRVGADDYVVKPFSMAELHARIEAVLRRGAYTAPERTVIEAGRIRIDVTARSAEIDGVPVALTRKEFDILMSLARQPGLVVPRDRILLDVWQTTWTGRHTVEVHVGSLRAKLGDPGLVETVRGVGYRLRVG